MRYRHIILRCAPYVIMCPTHGIMCLTHGPVRLVHVIMCLAHVIMFLHGQQVFRYTEPGSFFGRRRRRVTAAEPCFLWRQQ